MEDKRAWELTEEAYDALSPEDRFNLPITNGGGKAARPYHSNFWVCELLSAIQTGEHVPLSVLNSVSLEGSLIVCIFSGMKKMDGSHWSNCHPEVQSWAKVREAEYQTHVLSMKQPERTV